MMTVVYVLIVLILLAAVTLAILLHNKKEARAGSAEKYKAYVLSAANDFSFPPENILAVIRTESDFKPDALSKAGARGLMQIMPNTLKDINRMLGTNYTADDLYDPAINIRCGTKYLSYLYQYFGDYDLAYAAYNAGMGNVEKWLTDARYAKDHKLVKIPFPETARYVEKIHTFLKEYEDYFE